MKKQIIALVLLCTVSGASMAYETIPLNRYHGDVNLYHGDAPRREKYQAPTDRNRRLPNRSNTRSTAPKQDYSRQATSTQSRNDRVQDRYYDETYRQRTYRQGNDTYRETYHRESHYERSYRQGRVGQRYW